ncbi:hypothetical protein N0V93_007571 [Gnomoniopsis smithogilvyi]|uniref:Heterokaryon incompatibility domain-containing protein n=1 Tax=Gnomoniopsis smithogilvyi TaxID=1191159 RepID=A0A9W8YQC6_9PEZI|nr:hypothetical protein N0V93_007571 [Gnomoniopsis smithogilvyi]
MASDSLLENAPIQGPDYLYSTLPEDKDQIRLLILDPGHEDDPLSGSLISVKLEEAPAFEAISYVWGCDNRDHCIHLNGKPLSLTPSMSDALRQTRQLDKPRTLWADSICINQGDSVEKGHQVFLMGRIYQRSEQTVLCLGTSRQHRDVARDVSGLIGDVNRLMDGVFNDPEFTWDWDSFPESQEDDPLFSGERWESWIKMGSCKWFSRGWVVQEAALANKAVLLWAGAEIKWSNMLRAYSWLLQRTPFLSERRVIPRLHLNIWNSEHRDEQRTLRARQMETELSLSKTLWILHFSRQLELTIQEDRIYAFMAIPTSDGAMSRMQLQPDYSDSTSYLQVYKDFAVKYLEQTSDLDLLACVQQRHGDQDDNTYQVDLDAPRQPDLPSWVPRWDFHGSDVDTWVHDAVPKIYPHAAAKNIACSGDGSILHVKGIILDSVEFVSREIMPLTDPADTVRELVSVWRKVVEQIIKQPRPHESPFQIAMSFLAAVNMGSYYGEWNEWVRSMAAFARILENDNSEVSTDAYANDEDAMRISKYAVDVSSHRQFILLRRGYVGMAPQTARIGDTYAIIFGTRAPFILRKMAGKGARYNVVGWGYVQNKRSNRDGVPNRMDRDQNAYDWEEWSLPTRDIFLC